VTAGRILISYSAPCHRIQLTAPSLPSIQRVPRRGPVASGEVQPSDAQPDLVQRIFSKKTTLPSLSSHSCPASSTESSRGNDEQLEGWFSQLSPHHLDPTLTLLSLWQEKRERDDEILTGERC
jgi:hypothetical protein